MNLEVSRRLADLRRILKRGAGRAARQMQALAPMFFKNATDAFVLSYRPEDLLALISCAYRVMILTRGEKVSVSVFNPEEKRHGFSSDRTVIQISAPDGPFYVTSVRERLRSMNHSIAHLIHPILPVDWDSRGRLESLGDARLPGRQSLVHIEIDRVEDRQQVRRIETAVREVFDDIHLAVRDYERMRSALAALRHDLQTELEQGQTSEDIRKLDKFLLWLDSGNFVFLGCRQYDLLSKNGKKYCAVRRGSGLGILSREKLSRFYSPVPLSRFPAAQRRELLSSNPYVISQTNRPSPIYRRERMVYVGVKHFDARGRVTGAQLWLGLFTNRVEGLPPTEIPILQEKFEQVVSAEGVIVHSHDYREMYGIYSSYPKDVLFSATVSDLRREIRAAMAAQNQQDFKATFRPSSLGNEISVIVVMSKDKFARGVRLQIEDRLRQKLAATRIEYTLSMGAEGGEFARLYFSCITARKSPVDGTFADLERELAEIAKSWLDHFREELVRRRGPKEGQRLSRLYGGAFSVEFQSHTTPAGAVHDIAKLESLYNEGSPAGGLPSDRSPAGSAPPAPQVPASPTPAGPLQIDLFNSKSDPGCSRLKLYHLHAKLLLSDIMPVLTDHGFRVVDEVSNSVRGSGKPLAFVHTFRVQHNQNPVDTPALGAWLCESILQSVRRQAECDPLCSLILLARLSPREVSLMRLYRNYLHQIVPVHTLRSIELTLVKNPDGARLLVDLFKARFDPALGPAGSAARRRRAAECRQALEDFLEKVDDMLEDRILRLMANAVAATVRANYFATPSRRALGIKIRGADIHAMPKPVPMFEIFVCAAEFEGIHLRGGKIARGGIRHSDRRDDFRTEILGLMKTQVVKNAIIVPTGAKGGFVVKSAVPRDRIQETVVACYRSFIRTLLDLSDNQIGGRVSASGAPSAGVSDAGRIIHPVGGVIYDEPDPYLVVAADKGTAHFSDIANGIALEMGFWMGDAFASGGKNGYDHKKLGITARGAWECIRHHLSCMCVEPPAPGRDQRALPVTCVAIGDMSGDVFGNGMLIGDSIRIGARRLSLRLLAAFNHQYIFLDPNPDPRKAFAERQRLFRLPRSSWADYDRKAISPGGAICLRSSKKIALSRQAAELLEIPSGSASGEEVIRAILKMKVDLLYNGGIGTYIKSAAERHVDAGDSANDRVRINSSELRCKIVGEGGNVGLTQAARIEYAKSGGRINTDAVDNSAGVDLSDHEVNLKILLRSLNVTGSRRLKLLRHLTGPVCRSVLRDNALQSRILSIEEWRSAREMDCYPRLLETLGGVTGLSREIDGLPSDKEIAERAKSSKGLLRPELAVILAHVKMAVDQMLLEQEAGGRVSDSGAPSAGCVRVSDAGRKGLSSDPVLGKFFVEYFPAEIVRAFGRQLRHHGLAEHITATQAANTFVNHAGLTAAFRLSEECQASVPEIVRAYAVAETLVGAESLRMRIQDECPLASTYPDGGNAAPPAILAWDFLEDGLVGIARWLLKEYAGKDMSAALSRFKTLPGMLPRMDMLLSETEKKKFLDAVSLVRSLGVKVPLARKLAEVKMSLRLLELQVSTAKLRQLR